RTGLLACVCSGSTFLSPLADRRVSVLDLHPVIHSERQTASPNFADSSASRMTWLPMLIEGRGNQKELRPKPPPSTGHSAPTQKGLCPSGPTQAGRRNEAVERAQTGAPATY